MTVSSSAPRVKHRMPVDATSLGDSAASTVNGRLERLLVQIVALEFLVITATCYLASAIYYEIFPSTWPRIEQYIPAALSIALLAVFIFGGDIIPDQDRELGWRSLKGLERDKTGPMPSYERVLAGECLHRMNPVAPFGRVTEGSQNG